MTTAAPEGVSLILPSLNPSDKFDAVVDQAVAAGFADIVIVDDGSREDCKGHFRHAARHSQVTVLTHPVNRGKGQALRTAFAFLLENRPDCRGAVTIDGDGQHRIADILAVAEAVGDGKRIVMGCRDFSGPQVPARSRSGNRITCGVFRLVCGIRLRDTQTGLRGIPAALFPALLQVRGDRFEYETNMLLDMKRMGVGFRELPIETVYEDDNSESHFRPVRDSVRIYKFILLYLLSSLAGAGLDLLVFYVARLLLQPRVEAWDMSEGSAVLCATVLARACSSFLNFNLNKSVVFHGAGGFGRTMLRYYCLAIPQMLLSAGLVYLLSRWASSGAGVLTTLIKFVVDLALFFVSFRVQQGWVFREEK